MKQTITKKSTPPKSTIPSYLQEIHDMEDQLDDETIENEFTFEVTPEGEYPARLVEYVELGKHAGNFEGKPTKPAPKVRLVFELLDEDLAYEIEDASGKKRTAYPTQSVELTKGSSSRSKFLKFLKAFQKAIPALANKKQMVFFLDQPIVLKIEHTAGKKDPSKTYINIKETHIQSVVYKDKRTKEVLKVDVPAATRQLRVFLWNNPTIGQWDSLFIDGEREGKDGEKVSKNWIQEKILAAVNYNGSEIAALLEDGDMSDELPDDPEDDIPFEEDDTEIVEDDEEVEESEDDILDEDDSEFLEDEEAEEEEEEEEVEEKPAPRKKSATPAPKSSLKAPVTVSAKLAGKKTTSPTEPVKKRAAQLAKDIGLKK